MIKLAQKHVLFLLTFLCSISIVFAQQKKDPRTAQFDFVPGKIIVKLKDNVDTKTKYNAKGVGTSGVDVGTLLGIQNKVTGSKVLFSEKSVNKSLARKKSSVRDPRLPNPHTLKNTFLLELNDKEENVLELAEELNKRSDVEYAEPDYNYSVNDFTIDSEVIYPKSIKNNNNAVVAAPNDPLYAQQTNITTTNIDDVWEQYTTGDNSETIAILDTGVDYTHPDLEANIWINEAELNGVAGFDDDGNGYIDDIRGWDFINLDNAPLDDNMHGTHVAGIAGAVGDNGIGIAGAAWNVKLMPIKVFQSNGAGNSSTIAEGVNYASDNGASILNMSFGNYAESMTLRNALENAYATSVLVASAGNDGVEIGPCGGCAPSYPAAYTYVIGVEDSPKPPIGYTNYDLDGPIFSRYANLLNYEVTAPGTGIMSTVPNGGYRTLTGTSMSAPLVAGAIALYNQQRPADSKELLFGNLINTSATYIDVLKAIEVTPTPMLTVVSAIQKDTINGQNGNDFIEPGETIEVLPLVKNYWGPTDDVRVGIEFAEFEDQTKATILEDEISIGSIRAYATLQDLTKSLKIKIADHVVNNVNIVFILKVWSGPNKEFMSESTEFVINVKNSVLLYGYYEEDLTLTANKEYLVSDNFAMAEGTLLTIEPGVKVYVSDNVSIRINGSINAIGNKDERVTFLAENSSWGGISLFGQSKFEYCVFRDVSGGAIFGNARGSNIILHKCILFDNIADLLGTARTDSYNYHLITNSNIIENVNLQISQSTTSYNFENNNFINNLYNPKNVHQPSTLKLMKGSDTFKDNSLMNNISNTILVNPISMEFGSGSNASLSQPNYFGTSDTETAGSRVIDFFENGSKGILTLNYASNPSPFTNGIVWKVLVNGKDAQDEYDEMDPVGVGAHTFAVYFNREMDQTKPPQISYGVREPYNQKIISEEGTWSADGKIYTVSHEIKIGAADGINRIRVQDARDLDYFEIPVEDHRFNMLVQSAGSASTGFAATPGLGEVSLEWANPSDELLSDVLGYNMYRYEAITDSTFTAVQKINTALITDLNFKDYEVEEETKYFYKYKILRTSFDETDFSKTVTTVPLTSKLGDANGDNGVDVMDLVQNVDYILGNNPKPFIFKAADVNDDASINVLDIVGIVDVIQNPSSTSIATQGESSINYYSSVPVGDATFYWDNNDLYVKSAHAITGLQLAFDANFTYTAANSLPKFEWLNYEQDSSKVLMMYSFKDLNIPAGSTKILSKTSAEDVSFDIDKAVVASSNGTSLNVVYQSEEVLGIDSPEQGDRAKIFTLGANPTKGEFNVFYYLPEQMGKVQMSAYTLQGERVWIQDTFKNTAGQNRASVDLSALADGVYVFVIDVLQGNQVQSREVNKIIVNK